MELYKFSGPQRAKISSIVRSVMELRKGSGFRTERRGQGQGTTPDERASFAQNLAQHIAWVGSEDANEKFAQRGDNETTISAMAIANIMNFAQQAGASPLEVFEKAAMTFALHLGYESEFVVAYGAIKDILDIADETVAGRPFETPSKLDAEEQQSLAVDDDIDEQVSDERQIKVVRDAYWSTIRPNDDTARTLAWYLKEIDIENPSMTRLKAFFDVIPDEIFYTALEWSFHDTSVRDDMHLFVREEHQLIRAAVAAAEGN